jgi:hypothetical protein
MHSLRVVAERLADKDLKGVERLGGTRLRSGALCLAVPD